MFKNILLIITSILLLTACATDMSTPTDIRPELSQDAKELYNLIDKRFKDAQDLTIADTQKMNIFSEKYINNEELNEQEHTLALLVMEMIFSTHDNYLARQSGDDQMSEKTLKRFIESSEKVKSILDLK